MHAELRLIDWDPEPASLSADPADFNILARLYVGPADGPGEESFDLTVCSPEWLAAECRRVGIVDGRHHVIVGFESFDQPRLAEWFASRVRAASGEDWNAVAEKLSRLGFWEFEDYTES